MKTYRYMRVVMFPSSLGISPDKRFTRTELQHNYGITANDPRKEYVLEPSQKFKIKLTY